MHGPLHPSETYALCNHPFFLLPNILITKQRPLPTLLMINNGRRITEFPKLPTWHVVVRIMDRFPLEVSELGYPIADVIPIRIAFLRLGEGVEDTLNGDQLMKA